MKRFMKIISIAVIAMVGVAGLSACGGSEGGSSVSGQEQTWGNIKVFVPDGMTIKGGTAIDSENKDALSLTKADEPMSYINVSVVDAESAASNIQMTKDTNHGSDISDLKAGDTTWSGVTYTFGEKECLQLSATIGDTTFMVMSYGYAHDDEMYTTILGSLSKAQ